MNQAADKSQGALRGSGRRAATQFFLLFSVSWGIVLAIRETSLGGQWEAIRPETVTLVIGWLTCFVLGFVLPMAKQMNSSAGSAALPSAWLTKCIVLLSALAALGAIMVTYEFAVTRGYGFWTPVEEIRQLEILNAEFASSGSLISGLGRILATAILPAWLVATLAQNRVPKFAWVSLVFGTLIVIAEQSWFEGGRLFVASLILSVIIGMLIKRSPSKRRQNGNFFRRTIVLVLILVPAIAQFGSVFLQRISSRGTGVQESYVLFSENFGIDVPAQTVARLGEDFGEIYFVAYMFWIYLTQGLTELDIMISTPALPTAYGALEFPQIAQAVGRITGIDLSFKVFEAIPNPGTYTTIIGWNYLDFGFFGSLVFAFVLAALTCLSIRTLSANNLGVLYFVAPILGTVCIFCPVISLVVNLWPAAFIALVVGYFAKRKIKMLHVDELHRESGKHT